MMKMIPRVSKALALCLLLAASVFFAATPPAFSAVACGANLPTAPVTMRVEVNEYDSCATILNSSTYLDTTLSGIVGSYDIGNGTYTGTCVDLIGDILDLRYFGATYTVQMYSSLAPPDNLKSYPWEKINYVLNHANRANGAWNWLEVQAALWTLVHGCTMNTSTPNYPLWTCPNYRGYPFPYGVTSGTNYGCPPYGTAPDVNLGTVAAIVADANKNGASFVPSSGQIYAIILDPRSCTGSSYCGTQYLDMQLTIIESRCTDCTGSIGDFVWYDANRNGIQDAGEAGISGVTVSLKSISGDTIATKITGADGSYEFTGLCPGTYVVEVNQGTLPPGYTPTQCNQGSNDAYDSDSDVSGCAPKQTVELTTTYPNNPTIDFGFVSDCTGSIGDLVWYDANRNGIQDVGETGIQDVTVYLKGAGGNIIDTKITDANGFYEFAGLCPGTYVVEVNQGTLPTGYTPTQCNQGSNDAYDSDADADNCTPSQTVELTTAYPNNPTIDFGFVSPCAGTIGDYVWYDLDRDGIQDAGETGIQGVTVYLKGAGGAVLYTTTTDANGGYLFAGLCPGTYVVEVDSSTLPPGYTPTQCNQGSDDAMDSDSDLGDCTPRQTVTLGNNQNNVTIDFGFVTPCTGEIGDYAWVDTNKNGCQDADEPGLEGVVVELYKGCPGGTNPVQTVKTDASGYYRFTNLCAGQYQVVFGDKAGYTHTVKDSMQCNDVNNNQDNTKDSDCGGPDTCVTLPDNERNLTIDCGYVPECGLAIFKGCEEVLPPTTDWASCKGKIQQFTMIWPSDQGAITISGINNDAPGGKVSPGQKVTFKGPFSVNDLYLNITGAVTGRSTFHVSCSDADMDGRTSTNLSQQQLPGKAQDCGKFEGDGKALSGTWINTWLLDGLVDAEGKVLNCSPESTEPTNQCSFETQEPPQCGTGGTYKPSSLTFQYTGTGNDCSYHTDTQAAGKVICTPTGASNTFDATKAATIVAVPGGTFTVQPGGMFTIPRTATNSVFTLTNSGGTETITIHTSCSQPLKVGDVYYDLTLVAEDGVGAGPEVKYNYTVKNTGEKSLTNIVVIDDKLGPIGTIPFLGSGDSTTFSMSAYIAANTINIAKATADATEICPWVTAQASATVSIVPPPGPYVNVVGATAPTVDKNKFYWKLTNSGTDTAILSKVEVFAWPSQQGKLKKIKLDGDTSADPPDILWRSNLATNPAVISVFTADVNKKKIAAGQTRTFTIEFEKDYTGDVPSDYKFTITFEGGTTLSW